MFKWHPAFTNLTNGEKIFPNQNDDMCRSWNIDLVWKMYIHQSFLIKMFLTVNANSFYAWYIYIYIYIYAISTELCLVFLTYIYFDFIWLLDSKYSLFIILPFIPRYFLSPPCLTLLWRHNGRDSVSNHQHHDCLLNRSFGRRSK